MGSSGCSRHATPTAATLSHQSTQCRGSPDPASGSSGSCWPSALPAPCRVRTAPVLPDSNPTVSVPSAAVTNHYKLRDSKQHKYILLRVLEVRVPSGSYEVKPRGQHSWSLLEALAENPLTCFSTFCFFQLADISSMSKASTCQIITSSLILLTCLPPVGVLWVMAPTWAL